MNFNYDLATWIDYFVGAFICCFGLFMMGKILLNQKMKNIKIYSYLFIIIFSILVVIIGLLFDNIGKIFIVLILLFLMYKVMYKENNINSSLYSIAIYILLIFSETTVSIILMVIQEIFKIEIIQHFLQSIFINTIIAILGCLYTYILKEKVNKLISKVNKKGIFHILILGIIAIVVTIASLFDLSYNNWIFNYKFILNIVIIVSSLILIFILLKQYLENKEMTEKYALLNDYLKTSAELIEKYSATTHKYKNNLIIIKGYMKSDMKEANKYIDSLLDQMENKKYSWVKKINYIPVDTIRYLIYYKLSKAETENLKIMVDVSQELKNISSNIISAKEINILSEIIGEFFDNAIYASSESKEKELNLAIYKENDNIIISLSNTYKGNINLNLITNNGFTTKGKGHGFGLYDVEKTVKKTDWIELKYNLLDNYFVVKLIIKKQV